MAFDDANSAAATAKAATSSRPTTAGDGTTPLGQTCRAVVVIFFKCAQERKAPPPCGGLPPFGESGDPITTERTIGDPTITYYLLVLHLSSLPVATQPFQAWYFVATIVRPFLDSEKPWTVTHW